jgi:hypothetical protein
MAKIVNIIDSEFLRTRTKQHDSISPKAREAG